MYRRKRRGEFQVCEICEREYYVCPSIIKAGKGRFCSAECHYESMRRGEYRQCEVCGRRFYVDLWRLNQGHGRFCSLECSGVGRLGPNHPGWKGGIHHKDRGYLAIHCPSHPNAHAGGYIYLHRWVMEQKLGRYLEPEEVVHHVNGDKSDNRPENLQLFSNKGDHARHHHSKSSEEAQ